MLEKYKDEQPVLYNLLTNSIKNNKLSHAYLFESNNNPNSLDIIYSFVKEIMCPRNITCDKCSICSRIDNGNYLELKVIEPDGLHIKKEQMSELQEEFSKVSIEANRKIYIIKDCEKMNLQASNSILKFLEEPIDNITAILVTNNINAVLRTIVSRCQVISINKSNYLKYSTGFENISTNLTNSSAEREKFINDERNLTIYNNAIEFLNFYEANRSDIIVYEKKIWHDKFKDKNEIILALDIIINFYYDLVKYQINGQVSVFVNEIEFIKKMNSYKLEDIIYRLELFLEIRKLMNNNLNTNLLVDYMIIKLERR